MKYQSKYQSNYELFQKLDAYHKMKFFEDEKLNRSNVPSKRKAPSKRKESPVGNSLVRPDDIVDAVDGQDLLDTLLAKNIQRVSDVNHKREIVAWISDERKKIKDNYVDKARKAYQKIWNTCGSSSVGHNYRLIDQGGYNVKQCDICSHCTTATAIKPNDYNGQSYRMEKRRSESMNDALIGAMADKMIELDLEVGILSWPTEDDYVTAHLPTPKKRGFFR